MREHLPNPLGPRLGTWILGSETNARILKISLELNAVVTHRHDHLSGRTGTATLLLERAIPGVRNLW